MNYPEEGYNKVVIVRSAVPARKQGFLPGNDAEKNEVFELPYQFNVEKLFNNPVSSAYKYLKNNGVIQFISTSYLRGMTFEDSIIIMDEVQNCNIGEINTLVTRTGKNSRLIIIGDSYQNDLFYLKEDSCIDNLGPIISKMPSFDTIQMTIQDNCRDDVIKEWLIASNAV